VTAGRRSSDCKEPEEEISQDIQGSPERPGDQKRIYSRKNQENEIRLYRGLVDYDKEFIIGVMGTYLEDFE
jgi:hypothetical protein